MITAAHALRRRTRRLALLGASLLCAPLQLHAQDAGSLPLPGEQQQQQAKPTTAAQEREAMQAELRELEAAKQQFDARIQALEVRLGQVPPAASAPSGTEASEAAAAPSAQALTTQQGVPAQASANEPSGGGVAGFLARHEKAGTFDPNAGWVLVDDPKARLNLGIMAYSRYLYQNSLDPTYVDTFGRTIAIDRRNEVQLYKVSLQFKGWLLDPRFQFLFFAWTNNANQGEGGQVVIAGFLRYKFASWLSVSAGIMPLPTTRSTNYSFPKWLRHDNRVMADEFYRGSYTSGIDAFGQIARGLQYRVMLGNNLSTLGVSSKELDNKFDSFAAALWWMPTTGEFGPSAGFGDYEYHRKVATYIGVNYTHSTETAQGQPSENDFENSQIRLTDGTLLFSPDPYLTGGKVEQAQFQMASVDLGVKYKGFSLEGQWFWRRVNDFKTIGFIPVNRLADNGFALQASAMPVKDLLQAYVTASKIWGANGNPTEYSIGLNIYPFRRREMHVNLEALKLNHSPVGGYHMPIPVGGNGWVFLTDWVIMF